VGGKFFASTEDVTHPLLLVAGGIGIAPILGMIQTLLEEQLTESSKQSEDRKPKLKAILLCSTKNPRKQPMYREIIDAIKQSKGAVRCVFHITDGELLNPKDRRISPQERNVSTVQGRIDTIALRESLSQLQSIDGEAENISKKKPLAFLCGPPAMSDATEASLLELEMPKADVRLERWW
jgi:ferredoxin-NADP reductase